MVPNEPPAPSRLALNGLHSRAGAGIPDDVTVTVISQAAGRVYGQVVPDRAHISVVRGTTSVVRAMATHVANAAVQLTGLARLAFLAAQDNAALVAASGGATAVATGMAAHQRDVRIAQAGCLVAGLPGSAQAMVAAGVIPASVVMAMRCHPSDPALQRQGLQALAAALATGDLSMTRGTKGQVAEQRDGSVDSVDAAVDAVVSASLAFQTDAQLQARACDAIGAFAASVEACAAAIEAGALRSVVMAMRRHTHDPAVQASGTFALARLAAGGPLIKERVTVDGGAEAVASALLLLPQLAASIPPVVAVPPPSLDTLRMMATGCAALGRMATGRGTLTPVERHCKRMAVEAGATEAVMGAMQAVCGQLVFEHARGGTRREVAGLALREGCHALCNLAAGENVCKQALERCGAAALLVAVMRALPSDLYVQREACEILRFLSNWDETTLVTAAAAAVVAALRVHVADEALRVSGTRALWNMGSASAACKRAVIAAGGLGALAPHAEGKGGWAALSARSRLPEEVGGFEVFRLKTGDFDSPPWHKLRTTDTRS